MNLRTVTGTISASALCFVLALGLSLAVVPAGQADTHKPMTETEMSEVSGQAQATTIEKLATVVENQQMFKQLDGRLAEDEETSLGKQIMMSGLAGEQRNRSLAALPVNLISMQVLQPEVMAEPGAREVITHEAFLEGMEIAGTFAKMFATP